MLGAIIGDMVGSVYEFNNTKRIDFPFFSDRSTYTDDSIMTIAVAEWLLSDRNHSHEILEDIMVRYAGEYPHPMGGYGGGFAQWLFRPERLVDYRTGEMAGRRVPYNSWGNGAAMRAAAIGWMFDSFEETEKVAGISAAITHNHPEGIKGAQATAVAVYLARIGYTKNQIRERVHDRYGYDLSQSVSDIRKTYGWEDSCQGTVPPAICAFLDSVDFESAIRLAVSLGGDSDTLACITGAIAEAFYRDIPKDIFEQAKGMMPASLMNVIDKFAKESFYGCVYDCYGKTEVRTFPRVRVFSPKKIDSLLENQVFVYGSNIQGQHHGGAARIAYERFGAVWGKGVGHHGKTYAIPTMQGGPETIKPYVDEFNRYASEHPELTFLVTRIGCGIAGFKDGEIAPLFVDSLALPNVLLPESFHDIILGGFNMCEEIQLPWDVEWFKELTPDIPLNEEQYGNLCKGYYPDWDCRYAPIKIGDWIYVVRSGYWLNKYRFQKREDGLYHLMESYTSRKDIGRNMLMFCIAYGYFRPAVLEREEISEYMDMYGSPFEAHLTVLTEGKPSKCLDCEFEYLKDVIYGEPSEEVDQDKVVLGGCCIDEFSHNWECPQCHARYKSFDSFE